MNSEKPVEERIAEWRKQPDYCGPCCHLLVEAESELRKLRAKCAEEKTARMREFEKVRMLRKFIDDEELYDLLNAWNGEQ